MTQKDTEEPGFLTSLFSMIFLVCMVTVIYAIATKRYDNLQTVVVKFGQDVLQIVTTNKLNEFPPLFGKFSQNLVQSLTANASSTPESGASSQGLPLSAYLIPEIVAKAKPAVVEIVAMDEKGSPTTLGTGFFVSSDGLVVTNFHVIKGATSLSAVNNSGAIFLFERVVAQPTGVDLAILQFRASDVPFLHLGKSATAVEGQKVIVIGNPTGLTGTVSDGIISAFREKRSLIQITAPLSPGSSGSPVMNEDGQVIGVATLQIVEGQNLNFAIPVEKVSAALVQLPSEQLSGLPLPTATPTQAIDAKGYLDRGMTLYLKKEYDKAINDFNEAIRLEPNYALAYLNRGNAYSDLGNHDNAISDYNEAIRLEPNYALAYLNRGVDYEHKGNFDTAISDYNEAIRLDPHYALTYLDRGVAYGRKGNDDKAIDDFNEAIRLDPNSALAYQNRGVAYERKGNFDTAISDYNERSDSTQIMPPPT